MMKTKQGAVGGGRGEGAEQGLWEGLGELGGLGSLCHISGSTCHPHLTMLWGQGPLTLLSVRVVCGARQEPDSDHWEVKVASLAGGTQMADG